ncbi:MAG: NAD(+)/NADH kinase [Deltaproteobacteria bacterium]|nr:NAD(+)/NADH kinase [Deltaproteobacteria bacterium]
MRPVGIIANPASGKDIRRLVAYGSVFSNREKRNIIKRVLLGLDSARVEEVFIMPDCYGIGARALEGLDLSLRASFLDMGTQDTQDDSTRAAKILNDMDTGCIVVLGGDGTNRVVAKTCGETPLLSIATGTNNVFCSMVEGTLAGIAAGIVALSTSGLDEVITREPRLEIWHDSELLDIALVDVVISTSGFVASRAIWDVSTFKEIFLTRADPGNIGLSSLGGYLCPLPSHSKKGLYIKIGPGQKQVKAPIAPGLIPWVPIESFRLFEPDEAVEVSQGPAIIALDGERELSQAKKDRLVIKLNLRGPRLVNLSESLRRASEERLFVAGQI